MAFRSILVAVAACGALTAAQTTPKTTAPAAFNPNAGACATDDDCVNFPGTVCVQYYTGSPVVTRGKCTANYGQKPACRGAQSGLCPQYYDTTLGYMSTQCVLVDRAQQGSTGMDAVVPVNRKTTAPPTADGTDAGTTPSSGGTTTGGTKPAVTNATKVPAATNATKPAARRLAATVTTTAAPVDTTTTDGTEDPDLTPAAPPTADTDTSAIKAQACPSDKGLNWDDPNCWLTTALLNRTIVGQYRCVDTTNCAAMAWASQLGSKDRNAYCQPKACVTGTNQLCNNRGTCQVNDPKTQPMAAAEYTCRCGVGSTGTKCEKSSSNTCDVDCGFGGQCVDRACTCFAPFSGKGSDSRCTKCTKNAACFNNGTCDTDSGKCVCGEGFFGPTCAGKVDNCAGVACANGGQPYVSGTSCKCKCAQCTAAGVCPDCGGPDSRDCSSTTGSCPVMLISSHAPSLSAIVGTTVAAAIVFMFA
ncbi:Aste57867_4382 [Aphanomyces stellatus]|uniref:Aste57867_4382 protein n=1 Tax=Aphanomyces stellatus TaxID=120398 RepID=A0A485KCQ4_9STRA|nr:hypothetical protein As57867_004370 [Aphanomyces stellatus]VFT81496.1 Aste57867_4382 [Aphanomyces stellatus]